MIIYHTLFIFYVLYILHFGEMRKSFILHIISFEAPMNKVSGGLLHSVFEYKDIMDRELVSFSVSATFSSV